MPNALFCFTPMFVAALSARVQNFRHFDINYFARVLNLFVIPSFHLLDHPNELRSAPLSKLSNGNRVEQKARVAFVKESG
ncbi:hypothetical protein [Bradyrhizobium sp. CCBAU 11357]|uniref:hypothetical protein n=1 Tax=Bradyrhizobium sp. CCBAU 11357 TaxID=1630808 RepID=UPI0004B61AC0|nr:hypothetical protein [Bradyrhizobium sp. CCBAU 11357]MDA9497374.1 hypothetical protein [Bradyrhizobium sp. CCBAU 11357]